MLKLQDIQLIPFYISSYLPNPTIKLFNHRNNWMYFNLTDAYHIGTDSQQKLNEISRWNVRGDATHTRLGFGFDELPEDIEHLFEGADMISLYDQTEQALLGIAGVFADLGELSGLRYENELTFSLHFEDQNTEQELCQILDKICGFAKQIGNYEITIVSNSAGMNVSFRVKLNMGYEKFITEINKKLLNS